MRAAIRPPLHRDSVEPKVADIATPGSSPRAIGDQLRGTAGERGRADAEIKRHTDDNITRDVGRPVKLWDKD